MFWKRFGWQGRKLATEASPSHCVRPRCLWGTYLERVPNVTLLIFESNVQEYSMGTMKRMLLDHYDS